MNLIKQKIIEIVSVPPKRKGDTGYMKLTEKEINKIVELFRETIQRFIEETKIPRQGINLHWEDGLINKIQGYNEAIEETQQKQTKWLKENL